jgi:hypothetical protein
VTGGAGFIESHVAEYLLNRGHEVRVVNLASGKCGNIPNEDAILRGRHQGRRAEIFQDLVPEVLCYQAAQMDVRRSVCEPHFDAEGQQRSVGHPPRLREVRRARLSGQASSPPREGPSTASDGVSGR